MAMTPPPPWPPLPDLHLDGEAPGTHDPDDGWLISLVDILTLLLTLFVLLLAYQHLAQPSAPPATPPASAAVTLPAEIRDQVEMATSAGEVDLIIKDDLLFDEGSTALKRGGVPLLERLAQLFAQNDYAVSVEGHSDDLPIHTDRFPSNWELSASRAAAVTRYFIECGIDPKRLTTAGYADTRPIAANNTAAGRARNRRVSLVVHLHSAATQKKIKDILSSGD